MEVVVFLVLFLAMTGHSSATYCICKDGGDQTYLQKAIDYACGSGADCSAILQNGACYNPNTPKDHCNYAVNSYFQRKGQVSGSCNFSGVATTSTSIPAQSSGCVYQSSSRSSLGSTTPSSTTPSTTTPTTAFGLGPTGLDSTDSAGGILLQNTILLIFPIAFTTTILWFSGLLLLWD